MAEYEALYNMTVDQHSDNSSIDTYESTVEKYLLALNGDSPDDSDLKCQLTRNSDSHIVFSEIHITTGHAADENVLGRGFLFTVPSSEPYTLLCTNGQGHQTSITVYQWTT